MSSAILKEQIPQTIGVFSSSKKAQAVVASLPVIKFKAQFGSADQTCSIMVFEIDRQIPVSTPVTSEYADVDDDDWDIAQNNIYND